MIKPRDEYLFNKGIEKGKLEVAKKPLEKMTIKEVVEITGLSEKQTEELYSKCSTISSPASVSL